VDNPLRRADAYDGDRPRTVFVGRGDWTGNFTIQDVPPARTILSVLDGQLSYIHALQAVASLARPDTSSAQRNGGRRLGGPLGVSRWFGWLDGHVYKGLSTATGQYDAGTERRSPTPTWTSAGADGSIKEGTCHRHRGYYVYPTAEGGALGRLDRRSEQGFARFRRSPGLVARSSTPAR
jgi:hypothetical protein